MLITWSFIANVAGCSSRRPHAAPGSPASPYPPTAPHRHSRQRQGRCVFYDCVCVCVFSAHLNNAKSLYVQQTVHSRYMYLSNMSRTHTLQLKAELWHWYPYAAFPLRPTPRPRPHPAITTGSLLCSSLPPTAHIPWPWCNLAAEKRGPAGAQHFSVDKSS